MPDEPSIHLAAGLQLQAAKKRRHYKVRLVRAGRVRRADDSPGPFEIPAEAIQQAVDAGKFTARAAFVDHAGWFENPSIRNLAGIVLEAGYNAADQAADGTIRLYKGAAGDIVADLFDQVLADAQDGEPIPDVGLSLVFYPRWKPRDACPDAGGNHDDPLVLDAFRKVESVDFVFQPAADGRVTDALTALSALVPSGTCPQGQALSSLQADAAGGTSPSPPAAEARDCRCEPAAFAGVATPNYTKERSHTMPEETPTYQTDVGAEHAPPASNPIEAWQPAQSAAWGQALIEATRDAMIQSSGLPPAAQARLRRMDFATPQEITAAIELQREILAELHQDDVVQVGNVPPRGRRITLGPTSLEQIDLALEALIAGTNPPDGIRPLSGIREFYTLMSGDYEMTGMFHEDRVYLANVTSSTMAGLVANRLNKRVINLFQTYPRWWERIVVEEDFSTLQQVRWITLGGVGELPTVPEGAAYTELTWDDQTETADFVKKGGYLGLTLEAMDKDDTGMIRAAPRALAQAAWLTLSKGVSAIFTDNSGTGPAMSDSNNLFDASNHSNLLTTALSYSEWTVVERAMMKQTELNSSERLGFLTRPRYCLVPIDLEATALEIFASRAEPGTANNDANIYTDANTQSARMAAARERVIVVPLWTDTNNWAAVADPNLYPSIAIGYRYGRTPEIFSVASPRAGLMFSNDTLPVKVRFFYAVGPTDWRGLHKSNVS